MMINFGKKRAKDTVEEERRKLIKEAREISRKLEHAYTQFNLEQDEDLIEATVFMMQSLNARYRYVLKRAREYELSYKEQGEIIRTNRMVVGEWV